MDNILYLIPTAGLVGLLFAIFLANKVSAADPGNDRMREIAGEIHKGAMAFLTREYRTLVLFVIILFAVITFTIDLQTAICFLAGSIASAIAGYIGMNANKANVRTANAPNTELMPLIAFPVALLWDCHSRISVLGIGVLYLIFKDPDIVVVML